MVVGFGVVVCGVGSFVGVFVFFFNDTATTEIYTFPTRRSSDLELQGFKTFPEKTALTFDDGITAVVGPNGSGKSNICDAIRWVLGEQSVKTLRCLKMEGLIFNGTPVRRPQGFAEVTLTIDNTERQLAFDGDMVAITRRYYRSGESEYLINKNIVRLKDINELFMDTRSEEHTSELQSQ